MSHSHVVGAPCAHPDRFIQHIHSTFRDGSPDRHDWGCALCGWRGDHDPRGAEAPQGAT
jgi:hypothetical protein